MDPSTQTNMAALMEVTLGINEETVSDKSPKVAPRKRRKSLGWGGAAGPLARLVYHDLRHPLTAILAYSEFLAKDDLNASERQDLHQEICLAVTRMNDLISSLLEASKDSQPQLPRVADIVSTIARGIRTVAVRPEFRGVAIRYEHRGVTQGRIDAAGLQQVIINMVLNACEAVSADSGWVEVRSSGRLDSIEITVSDNGPGVPEPIRRVLFQESVSHDKDGGMGLGLAIVQKIVRDHGGDVYLDATGENGTVFRLVLPFQGLEVRASASQSNLRPVHFVQEELQASRLERPDQKGRLGNLLNDGLGGARPKGELGAIAPALSRKPSNALRRSGAARLEPCSDASFPIILRQVARNPGSRHEGKIQESRWPRGRTGLVRRKRPAGIVTDMLPPDLVPAYTRWQAILLEENR